MKHTSVLFGLVLLGFICSQANAQQAAQQSAGVVQQRTAVEPYSVKADKLGETIEAWMTNYPKDKCGRFGDSGWGTIIPGEQVCNAKDIFVKETYANTSVNHLAFFYQGRLYRVELRTCYECALGISTALHDKYGVPTSTETEMLTNGFGAQVPRLIFVWTNGISTVTYRGHDNSRPSFIAEPLDSSIIVFTLDEVDKKITKVKSGTDSVKARSDM